MSALAPQPRRSSSLKLSVSAGPFCAMAFSPSQKIRTAGRVCFWRVVLGHRAPPALLRHAAFELLGEKNLRPRERVGFRRNIGFDALPRAPRIVEIVRGAPIKFDFDIAARGATLFD